MPIPVDTGLISVGISQMLNTYDDEIKSAVAKNTTKSWLIVGAAILAIVFLVKKVSK